MQSEFWLERWEKNQIGFHLEDVNPLLRAFWPELGVAPDKAVFVPLCGKSLDMRWLVEQGHRVWGVELAESAVRAFFTEAGEPFLPVPSRRMPCYKGADVGIFCGDFMDMTALELRDIGAVFDRGALVALPPRMRAHYADHMLRIIPDGTRLLLVTLEYDQSLIGGPPHAVSVQEVQTLYGARCSVERLHAQRVTALPPSFAAAGVVEAVEAVYRIVKRE